MADFLAAVEEVTPAFGASVTTLEAYRLNGILPYGERFQHLFSVCSSLVQQVSNTNNPLASGLYREVRSGQKGRSSRVTYLTLPAPLLGVSSRRAVLLL